MWGNQKKIMPRRGNLNMKINTQEECHVKRYREKTATNNPRRKAWNTSFPHSPQKESTLLTPWLRTSSLSSNEFACQYRRHGFDPWVGKVPWRRAWQPTPVFLPRKSNGQRSLAGCSPLGRRIRHNWATKQQQSLAMYNNTFLSCRSPSLWALDAATLANQCSDKC